MISITIEAKHHCKFGECAILDAKVEDIRDFVKDKHGSLRARKASTSFPQQLNAYHNAIQLWEKRAIAQ